MRVGGLWSEIYVVGQLQNRLITGSRQLYRIHDLCVGSLPKNKKWLELAIIFSKFLYFSLVFKAWPKLLRNDNLDKGSWCKN
jgi:hypothetical protein